MTKEKKKIAPVELTFKNKVEDLKKHPKFDYVCPDLAKLMRRTQKAVEKISGQHGVKLSYRVVWEMDSESK